LIQSLDLNATTNLRKHSLLLKVSALMPVLFFFSISVDNVN